MKVAEPVSIVMICLQAIHLVQGHCWKISGWLLYIELLGQTNLSDVTHMALWRHAEPAGLSQEKKRYREYQILYKISEMFAKLKGENLKYHFDASIQSLQFNTKI